MIGPNRRQAGRRLGLAACLALLVTACAAPPPPVAELTGPTMGTQYSVQLSPPPDDDTLAMLRLRIDERLRDINTVMSTYVDDSDLMRFNRAPSTDWQEVPDELVELVRRAAQVSRGSDGRYDVTTGPLVNLWGFGNAGDRDSPPTDAETSAVLQRIGYAKLQWRDDPPALRKLQPQIEIDLSSIAKGWAVDQLGELLTAQGVDDFLVEIGGETLARGTKADGTLWRIAIERPSDGARVAQGRLSAPALAVATSGDYRNYFEHNQRRYSHTIDPRSGQAVHHRLASVTVVADNVTDADAWATALMALGETDGPALAERLDLAALFIVRDGDDLREQATTALLDRGVWESRF